ncbi:Uncharacterized protein OBRU01_10133 [Operophtera brumata]|uniref:Uncharacterized protein n=1 Tax=Operophtera brumata TaxID=104452 RepID=A0A0L7LDG9_OPEBR|nr:Uncharacterized protein OBRU01_10133 [Operophtera brumata]
MFGGFKARLNLLGGKKKNDHSELTSDMFVTGNYRVNREDLYGYTQDLPKSRPIEQPPRLRPVKSTSNLVQPKTANPNLRNSTPAISRDPRGAELADRNSVLSRKELKTQEKEQKRLEKQLLIEQKKQAQEKAKQEKLMMERAKKETQKAKSGKKDTKKKAPMPQTQPQTRPLTQPQPQAQPQSQPQPQTQPQTRPQTQPQTSNPAQLQPAYSTNTLDSSISRSSGPPPYSEVPKSEPAQGTKDKSGNVIYSKPVDTGSWDIISQHREQISRPVGAISTDGKRKQMVMDLNYNFGATSNSRENSDA